MKVFAIAILYVLFGSSQALAVEGTLTTEKLGGKVIIIWKNTEAASEGYKLIEAEVHRTNPELLIPLISCIEKNGIRVITTDAGFASHDIMVIEGENSGCRGNIPAEYFKIRK